LSDRRTTVAGLESKLAKKQEQIDAWETGSKAKIAEWRRRSLPADPQLARTQYQNWLLELATRAKLQRPKVESSDGRPTKVALPRGEGRAAPASGADAGSVTVYVALPFLLQCDGSLDQLTEFLYGFYSAGHLHRIRRLNIKPAEKEEKKLELTIGIEAISLPDADRRDKLTLVTGGRLAPTELAPHRKAIVDRNLFAPYKPPPPPPVARREERPAPPPEPPKKIDAFDPSKYAYVMAIVSDGGQREVWLRSRIKDEKLPLRQGQRFEIGPMKGTVTRIEERRVEIESDGKRWTIALGEPIKGSEGDRKQ
jgi:hypothetical protein